MIRELLRFLPSNNLEDPPRNPATIPPTRRDASLNTLVPDDPQKPYDIKDAIHSVVDDGYFFEVHEHFAKNMVVGFARLDGRPVGIVANQPAFLAGVLDINASVKGARFVRFCDAFNIPLITFEDVPGFLAGHSTGIRRHHPARRKTVVRLRRSYRAENHRHHAQSLRRSVLRHGLEAHPHRRKFRLAYGGDRGDGTGEVPSTSSTSRELEKAPESPSAKSCARKKSRSSANASPIPSLPRNVATSTPSSNPPKPGLALSPRSARSKISAIPIRARNTATFRCELERFYTLPVSRQRKSRGKLL